MTDFVAAEYQARVAKAQAGMAEFGVDALLFCTEVEVNYFTGFRTLFWQSPTRPWFLVIPKNGDPIAVIPTIGQELMSQTWISDIRTWSSPDPEDEGVSLLAGALKNATSIGLPMGPETSLRMSLIDFDRLRRKTGAGFVDVTALVHGLRQVKSEAEIAVLSRIGAIASAGFSRVSSLISEGRALDQVFRDFKITLLEEGAEEVPYLVGGAGPGGYGSVISPPGARPLQDGDILMMDTGSTFQGYFCDFDRNYAIGHADDASNRAYETLWQATEAAIDTARPGVTCADLFATMQQVLNSDGAVGRAGHGLGLQLTESPSITARDKTPLVPGMVMTLEPSLTIATGKMMVHEENIVITDGAPILLSARAEPQLPIIS